MASAVRGEDEVLGASNPVYMKDRKPLSISSSRPDSLTGPSGRKQTIAAVFGTRLGGLPQMDDGGDDGWTRPAGAVSDSFCLN
ncbi:hypothetical protein DPEC_G00150700 [Dallia pectoralis]|uniref:Uncharacterized protein n=1 Tax=Dallia pectoralis TaxID=75939 RepID=A0ACC2GJH0_DALPE|nr:hypothetical protein DPEC_G00150700 [Dallia pectoralis]